MDSNFGRILQIYFCVLPMECILIKQINFEDDNITDSKVTAKSKKLRPLKITTCIGMLFGS